MKVYIAAEKEWQGDKVQAVKEFNATDYQEIVWKLFAEGG